MSAGATPPAYRLSEQQGFTGRDPQIYRRAADPSAPRRLHDSFEIPVRSGRAWVVPAGHVCRFETIEGPQVLDLNLWSLANPRERFWAARTRQLHGAHLRKGGHLWSTLPFLRPMVTMIADSLDYGLDGDGAGCHDLLGTRCDPYVNAVFGMPDFDRHCHSNLVRAVHPFGLTEYDVHDVINLFQVTGLTPQEEMYFMKPSPARVGDHVEFLAEIDLLMAASTCPGGDLSRPVWGNDEDTAHCHPIGIQVLAVDDPEFAAWSPSEPAHYEGEQGIRHGFGHLG